MSEQNKQLEPRKIAIVTGGSRGIGRNTVVSLAKRQVDSIFTFHTHSEDAKAVFFLTQKLLPPINDGGRIINVSTARTRVASPGGAVYASMKGAVEVLSRFMALELGPRRIAVNVVAPGPVATDFSGGIVRDNPAVNKRIAENTALGRAGVPDDLGPVIAFLLSEESHWINAQRIEVAGGVAI
jgi:NAD(P)-dependent dehydrogenase (short-subunit alcohol dehydrogenase family)